MERRGRGYDRGVKIYTRTGDDGTTGLIGGARVPKDDARLDCYGTVDELNAAIGWCATAVGDGSAIGTSADLGDALRRVQADLFVVGSHLATPAAKRGSAGLPPLTEGMVGRLESEIDAAESTLEPLANFILPGGSEAASRLHVARCVCRRAERLLVAFSREAEAGEAGAGEAGDPTVEHYLNRLSDWLFVRARAANRAAGVDDVPWRP